ncbi:hypothetical protein FOYG_00802 [Fusarium oxysporum NRRL 32931]|uniref:Uncharacterized protein n=1 Tax=Fusarium oxysporum NRRL 32931 TaxID=660029 RepID=W9J294_FUSOX|nr:hypothetical protein FOYG_00802 [Fusarium oxysporum NRRL 32931]
MSQRLLDEYERIDVYKRRTNLQVVLPIHHHQTFNLINNHKQLHQPLPPPTTTSSCLTTSPLSTTASARTVSLTVVSAPASSLTARSTPTRPASRAERPPAPERALEVVTAAVVTTSPLSTVA